MSDRRSAPAFVRSGMATDSGTFQMNLSKTEQRVLHVLALGGRIDHSRSGTRIDCILCVTRDGLILTDCTLVVFRRLRRKRLIASEGGSPYRISRLGRLSVRAQADNRG
jgi:uncharacterized protein YjhX (UPF0386 family)